MIHRLPHEKFIIDVKIMFLTILQSIKQSYESEVILIDPKSNKYKIWNVNSFLFR